jgi:hypothetical protein
MKRTDFEANLGQLGLHLAGYKNAAYYGSCEKWSLSLQPFPGDHVSRAKLAISAPPSERSIVLGRFLTAADVTMSPPVRQALEAGTDFRGRIGAKEVSFTSIGRELVVNIAE